VDGGNVPRLAKFHQILKKKLYLDVFMGTDSKIMNEVSIYSIVQALYCTKQRGFIPADATRPF
jgi:hypothetical protein